MVGSKIPNDDPHWCNFLLMLTMVNYVLAPVLAPDCCEYLKELIDDHHKSIVSQLLRHPKDALYDSLSRDDFEVLQ